MLVVIEGPDGAGKTTLIDSLRRDSGLYFWTLRPSRPPSRLSEIMEVLGWVRNRGPEQHILMDRHPAVSEPIYGPLFRNQNLLEKMPDPLVLDDVDLFIYCRPSDDAILAGIEKTRENQMAGVTNRTLELIEAYDLRFAQLAHDYDVLWYDYTRGDTPEQVARVLREFSDTQKEASRAQQSR